MSGQNRSTAVMQRRAEPHDSLDGFPTPPWAVRALLSELRMLGFDPAGRTVREPAANRGHMVRALAEWFARVEASDVHDYGTGFPVADYLFGPDPAPVDWTITNPPFRLAEAFIARARTTSRVGCAMLLRTAFLESTGRYKRLFKHHPPTFVFQFSERVIMARGVMRGPDLEYFDPATGTMKRPSTAPAYSWLVWTAGGRAPEFGANLRWIAPCRTVFERAGDYPEDGIARIPE